jgi:hydrogenase nickel incorporation protein HypA/HybF
MSLVQSLIEQVDGEVSRSGHAGRVLAVDLVIGRLSGVHVDSIQFAFEVLAPGTVIEGAALQIHQTQASLRCRACGVREPIDELAVRCRQCGSCDTVIEGGQELLLQSIELED